MNPTEMREQAQRWRSRVPRHDQPTADALIEAAGSFEDLADAKDAATPQASMTFIHRAFADR